MLTCTKPIDGGPKSLNAGLKFEEDGSDGEEPQDPKTKEQDEKQSQIKKMKSTISQPMISHHPTCKEVRKSSQIGCGEWMAQNTHILVRNQPR